MKECVRTLPEGGGTPQPDTADPIRGQKQVVESNDADYRNQHGMVPVLRLFLPRRS
jgi:hypothetical protein